MANFFRRYSKWLPLHLGNIVVVENHYKMSHFNSTFWGKKSLLFLWGLVTMKNEIFCMIFKHYELFMVIVFYNISCIFCLRPPFYN